MHWHSLPELTLPSSNLTFQVPFSNRATWLSSCRGLEPLQGSQENFSHLALLWWQRLDISVIFKRCTLSASLAFAWWPRAQLSSSPCPVYSCRGSPVSSRMDSALCSPRGQGAQGGGKAKWHSTKVLITCRRKLLLGQCSPNYSLQFKISQNDICWAKKKLCTPVCWSFPLQQWAVEGQTGEVIPSPAQLQPP